ncbi:hypothetical protein L3Q72_22755 [Vibrio sp. JC009]|uniref:hypothetical protein n=1 Tax=Vibrio sp. JC009 TaxID=2912314 RepID=UPI0023B1C08B|nr:hypothetical protein [Vibrio sp. JC009]WED24054.1 hypothetical protein L3Q72_22755 [Vibrio sp. JC009]
MEMAMTFKELNWIGAEFSLFVPFDVKNSFGTGNFGNKCEYKVIGSRGPGHIYFLRSYKQVPHYFPLAVAEGAKVDVDRYGQLSRSIVLVALPKCTLIDLGITSDEFEDKTFENEIDGKVLAYSLELLNKFAAKYAQVTNDFWVSIPTKEEILSHKIIRADRGSKRIPTLKMFPEKTYFSGGKGHFISTTKDCLLREMLREESPDTVDLLLLSAKDFISREQFALAIVQCAVAFEYYIYNDLIEFPSKTKRKQFMDKHTKKPDCGCHIGINEFCRTGISEFLGIEFSSTGEFENIVSNVTSVRNKIVHGTPVKVDKEQADLAISSTINAIGYLEKRRL